MCKRRTKVIFQLARTILPEVFPTSYANALTPTANLVSRSQSCVACKRSTYRRTLATYSSSLELPGSSIAKRCPLKYTGSGHSQASKTRELL